jgi:stage III sporulation protein AG
MDTDSSNSDAGSFYDMSEVEGRLKEILSSISGAGSCKVMITYESSEEIVPVINKSVSEGNTDEKDDSGGSRKISNIETEETIVLEEASGNRKPAISKKLVPKAVGAVVVCPGGDNVFVKEAVSKTIQALFDLPQHKIQVIKGS